MPEDFMDFEAAAGRWTIYLRLLAAIVLGSGLGLAIVSLTRVLS